MWKENEDEPVDIAGIDDGKPSVFTKKLLNQYEPVQLSASQLKQAIVEEYTRAIH